MAAYQGPSTHQNRPADARENRPPLKSRFQSQFLLARANSETLCGHRASCHPSGAEAKEFPERCNGVDSGPSYSVNLSLLKRIIKDVMMH